MEYQEKTVRKDVRDADRAYVGAIASHERTVAFIDIGTNSIRMLIAGLTPGHTYAVLREDKEIVRLGEDVFNNKRLTPQAMERATLVCVKFVELAKAYHCSEIFAVSTAAARESKNRAQFIKNIEHETGLDVRIISGREEARLIYLGVSSGVAVPNAKTLFVDIGGGSTEIATGDQTQYTDLESLGLGSIRLTAMFLPDGGAASVSPETYARMRRHVKSKVRRAIEHMKITKPAAAFGSSGTIINLAEIAQKHFKRNGSTSLSLSRDELKEIAGMLCALPLEERRGVPGINEHRADIIIGGAAILDVIMDEFAVDTVSISDRGLRHGMLAEYLARRHEIPQLEELTVRERSVLQLARACNVDEGHPIHVRTLAGSLFDSARELKLHDYGPAERELLQYAAFLHNVGNLIALRNNHLHSYYIIRHAELLGFDQKELSIIANIVRFYRKKIPQGHEKTLDELDSRSRAMVRTLSTILRVAEKLDRGHAGAVRRAAFVKKSADEIMLTIETDGDCTLELWGMEAIAQTFKKVFKRELTVCVT